MALDGVIRILEYRKRSDLSMLLSGAWFELDESENYGSFQYSRLATAVIFSSLEKYEQLRVLPEVDVAVIFQALLEIYPPKEGGIEITQVQFRLDPDLPGEGSSTTENLLLQIDTQKKLMMDVATGGSRIDSVNDKYKGRYRTIQTELRSMGLRDPNPYSDLWEWYDEWSGENLPTYQSRRIYIQELFKPVVQILEQGSSRGRAELFDEPTGWTRVDRSLSETRLRLEGSTTEEQYQAVGLLCRETLISVAQVVYDETLHKTLDGVAPSNTDAKRMLEAYLAVELGGSANEAARRHAKAALSFANNLQHKRTATFREAALCAEATTSVTNIIAIISGHRDP